MERRSLMMGKICLVTGATNGLGKVTVRALAEAGATVIGVGRSAQAIDATQAEIGDVAGALEFLQADLSSQAQIRDLVEQFNRRYDRLDVLINNAGALFSSYRETVDGIEMTFALNHLGYFLLTNLLLYTLLASAPARIVNVSSNAHNGRGIDFDDLGHRRSYDGWTAYGASKLANLLFTYELARRVEGTGVTVNALHPGVVSTNFFKSAGLGMRGTLTPEEGADTQIWLAQSDEVEGVSGKYFVRRREARTSDASYDQAAARRLWEVSARMTGLASE
ncbi:MAG: SDR family oxidoreductase [Anaerolineae bacterium]|nr:SDR family oxidoreductase [Anaerolineae bacterium]